MIFFDVILISLQPFIFYQICTITYMEVRPTQKNQSAKLLSYAKCIHIIILFYIFTKFVKITCVEVGHVQKSHSVNLLSHAVSISYNSEIQCSKFLTMLHCLYIKTLFVSVHCYKLLLLTNFCKSDIVKLVQHLIIWMKNISSIVILGINPTRNIHFTITCRCEASVSLSPSSICTQSI